MHSLNAMTTTLVLPVIWAEIYFILLSLTSAEASLWRVTPLDEQARSNTDEGEEERTTHLEEHGSAPLPHSFFLWQGPTDAW